MKVPIYAISTQVAGLRLPIYYPIMLGLLLYPNPNGRSGAVWVCLPVRESGRFLCVEAQNLIEVNRKEGGGVIPKQATMLSLRAETARPDATVWTAGLGSPRTSLHSLRGFG